MHTKLIPIKKDLLEKHGIYIKPSTLYGWHSKNRYSNLFVKVSKRLFLNLDEFMKTFMKPREVEDEG